MNSATANRQKQMHTQKMITQIFGQTRPWKNPQGETSERGEAFLLFGSEKEFLTAVIFSK
jgi:hypothetical protein